MHVNNSFRSRSESDASSDNCSENISESEESQLELNSDSSSNNKNYKKPLEKCTDFQILSSKNTQQSKIGHSIDSTHTDENSVLLSDFQKCVTDESSDIGVHCLKNHSPRINEKSIAKLKTEGTENGLSNNDTDFRSYANMSIPTMEQPKFVNKHNIDVKNFKKDIDKLKAENDECIKSLTKHDGLHQNSTKRLTSANNSPTPYKEKKRKFLTDKMRNSHEFLDQETNHSDILQTPIQNTVTKIYYSYFEHGIDDKEEIKEIK